MSNLLNNGKFAAAEILLATMQAENVDYKHEFKSTVHNLKTKLDKIFSKFRFDESEMQKSPFNKGQP